MLKSGHLQKMESYTSEFPSTLAREYMAGKHTSYFDTATAQDVAIILNSFISLAYELAQDNKKLYLSLTGDTGDSILKYMIDNTSVTIN